MPERADDARHFQVDGGGIDDLPPHRAAVPIPPVTLEDVKGARRGLLSWIGMVAAVLLHAGFLTAALLWGQGGELPPSDETVISVELVRTAPLSALARAPAPEPASTTASTPSAATPVEVAEVEQLPGDFPQEQASPEAGMLLQQEVQPTQEEEPQRPSALDTLRRLKSMLAMRSPQPARQARSVERSARPTGTTASTADDRDYLPNSAGRSEDPPARARAPSGDARSSGRGGASRTAMAFYKRRVRARIARNLPLGTLGSGRVAIGVRLSRRGGVMATSVLRSSGNPDIDYAALIAVRTAGPYPRPPANALLRQLTLSISFRFE